MNLAMTIEKAKISTSFPFSCIFISWWMWTMNIDNKTPISIRFGDVMFVWRDLFRQCWAHFGVVTIINWTNNKTFHFLIDHDICCRCFDLFSKVKVLILFRWFLFERETVFMAPRETKHFIWLKVWTCDEMEGGRRYLTLVKVITQPFNMNNIFPTNKSFNAIILFITIKLNAWAIKT